MNRIEAMYLNPGDTIAPLVSDEPAVVLTVFTREGVYGLTTEIEYSYVGAPADCTSTMRTLATRKFTVLERA